MSAPVCKYPYLPSSHTQFEHLYTETVHLVTIFFENARQSLAK